MATYSTFPVFIDGTRLDSSAYQIESKVRPWPSARASDTAMAGVDGEAASLNDDLEPTLNTFSMWLLGTDESGVIPAGSNAMSQCRKNLDLLSFLFSKRHALINVTETVDYAGAQREYYGKVIDSVTPEIRAGGLGRFTVSVKNTSALLQDTSTVDWSQTGAVSGTTYTVSTLTGSTGPVSDATILVTGPATNPQINDITTGAYVRLNATVAAGSSWRVNSATWASRYGTGLTLASADTTGTDGQSVTVYGGGTARFMRLQPAFISSVFQVRLSLTGSGFSGATAVAVRARRKFLQ